jgi:hypothetical protein
MSASKVFSIIDQQICQPHFVFLRYFSVVKENYEKSAKVYDVNCNSKGYPASCFNLGRLTSIFFLLFLKNGKNCILLITSIVSGKGVPASETIAEDCFGKYFSLQLIRFSAN